jgi:tripartite-type tricarboxylate transporter receptor subunit TctC
VTATLKLQGYDMQPTGPEEFAAFLHQDFAKWRRVAAAAGLRR